jgi:hypothetical protein
VPESSRPGAVQRFRRALSRSPADRSSESKRPRTEDLVEWWQSGDREDARGRKRAKVVFAVLVLIISSAMAITSIRQNQTKVNGKVIYSPTVQPIQLGIARALAIVAVLIVLFAATNYQHVKAEFLQHLQRQKVLRKMQTIHGDPELLALLQLNQAQLDAYHELTLSQAADAYRNTQVVIGIGLLVLIGAAVVAVTMASDTAGKLVAGGLGALGTALSGYIAATFLAAQQESLRQRNFYFRQPLVQSYLLTAERIALKLPEDDRALAWTQMASQVVLQAFGAPPPVSATTPVLVPPTTSAQAGPPP